MPGIRGAGSLMIAAALLVIFFAQEPVAGLSVAETAALLGLGGVSMIMAAAIIEGFGRHWTYGVQAIAMSGGLFASLLILYAFRGELEVSLDRAIGDIAMGRTVNLASGDVVAARKTDGSFLIKGEVNGHEARFIFDTGASTVVLRAENAAALGFKPETLNFTIPVSTANGLALAAPVGRVDHRKGRARPHRPLGRPPCQPARNVLPRAARLLRGARQPPDPAGQRRNQPLRLRRKAQDRTAAQQAGRHAPPHPAGSAGSPRA
jgi:aspartyl protease family protein